MHRGPAERLEVQSFLESSALDYLWACVEQRAHVCGHDGEMAGDDACSPEADLQVLVGIALSPLLTEVNLQLDQRPPPSSESLGSTAPQRTYTSIHRAGNCTLRTG